MNRFPSREHISECHSRLLKSTLSSVYYGQLGVVSVVEKNAEKAPHVNFDASTTYEI